MSLYFEAASFLAAPGQQTVSLKSRVFGAKGLKSTPSQLFALLTEAGKWSTILKEVVEHSQLLVYERKLTPPLALLIVHDLLLARKGVAAPATHVLRLAAERHKARLQAEFIKSRLRRGCSSVEALRKYVEAGDEQLKPFEDKAQHVENDVHGIKTWPHPRWVRINTLKTTLEDQLATTFSGYRQVDTLIPVLQTKSESSRILHIDLHIPDLIALPRATDVSSLLAYKHGLLILQDKASCFPAYLLNPHPADGDLVDACAAPGNKTTHLAALVQGSSEKLRPTIWACEMDKARALTLQKMITTAGAENLVTIKPEQDFLRLDPEEEPWCKIGALLLDPSCSGSGIIGRDERQYFVLPSKEASLPTGTSLTRKRKRKTVTAPLTATGPDIKPQGDTPLKKVDTEDALQMRLAALSKFQTKLLLHSFRFPSARKITYSTCSIYAQENEAIVIAALDSDIAKQNGWRILRRNEQVSGMRRWNLRGELEACEGRTDATVISEACLRCVGHSEEGTQGFFVAAFVRKDGEKIELGDDEDEEWGGFDD